MLPPDPSCNRGAEADDLELPGLITSLYAYWYVFDRHVLPGTNGLHNNNNKS